MSIKIIKRGICDTFQDEGRFGYQHLGINPNGAMDSVAMQIANNLVGNPQNTACLECFFPAAQIQFDKSCLIAISGANFTPYLNDEAIQINKPYFASEGSILKFTKPTNGMCCYIAVRGGFKLDNWLDSFSTNMIAKTGGYNGRSLLFGDNIHFKETINQKSFNFNWQVNPNDFYSAKNEILAIKGPEWDFLTKEAQSEIETTIFKLGNNCNRMAYTIDSNLQKEKNNEVLSSGVAKGTIQLLPNGKMLALMADHQTTGGYPRILQITAHSLPQFAQMQPNSNFQFKLVTIEDAKKLLENQLLNLQKIETACLLKLNDYF